MNYGAITDKIRTELFSDQFVSSSFSQFGEDMVIWACLETWGLIEAGFYIDIGAHHPRMISNTNLLHKLKGWRGINVEADPTLFKAFAAERPEDINLNQFVANVRETVEFTIFNHPAANTADATLRAQQLLNPAITVVDTVLLPSGPLSDIIDLWLPNGQDVGLLTVDVEGYDLQVLKSNNWEKCRPAFIAVEDHTMNLSNVQNSETFQYLDGMGYHLTSQVFVTSIYRDKRRFG